MKKKLFVIIIVILITAVLLPTISGAVVTPYFMAVNDTLLPFESDTMPYVSGRVIYVPCGVFKGVGVNTISIVSEDLEQARLYRGGERYVDFYPTRAVTEDQDGKTLQWPAPRRIGNIFYVPIEQVCTYFGLTYEMIDVSPDIIPQQQMQVIRIKPIDYLGLNGRTFVGMNSDALKTAYDEYFSQTALPSPTAPDKPGGGQQPAVTPPQKYDDITIHHSFYNLSAGGAGVILELLSTGIAADYRFCFFVSAEDIRNNAGLVRKISGNGHTIGIWLEEGGIEEYYETSAILFEAAKIKTVIAAGALEDEGSIAVINEHGIIYWRSSQSLVYDETIPVDVITDMLSTQRGSRQNMIASCSEFTALMLSGILSYLFEYEYSVIGITETTPPL